MSQEFWNYLIIGLTFATYIGIAFASKVGSTKEYYVASGGISSFSNGMATAAGWMSAATFISMAGGIAASGYDASRFLMGWTGGFVLLTTLIVPYLRKFGKYTVVDFLADRFESKYAMGFVGVVCAIFISMTYIMGQMRGVGLVFARLFEIEIATGVIIGSVIVFLYASIGGMKGITYTQVAQYVVMAFSYTVPAVFISFLLTGHVLPQLGLIGMYTAEGADSAVPLLEKLDQLNTELGFSRYTDGSLSTLDMFCITAALMCGTAGLPHVIVRFFTVKSVKAVRSSAIWTLGCIAVIYITAPALGAFARTNFMHKVQGAQYADLPEWFHNWENRGLIAWADKNGDGILQHGAGDVFEGRTPSFALDRGQFGERVVLNPLTANGNEVYYDQDILVMANPEMAGLPRWIVALVMAGCVAAALSTAAGLLLVLSTSISHDLMKKILRPNMSDAMEVHYARLASFGSLVVAAYFGINPPSAIVAKTVAFAFGLAASSFFPTILMGIFSKRVNKYGAIAGMVTGIGFTFTYITYFQFFAKHSNYWLGISPEGIGFVGMLINFGVTWVVTLFTPAPSEAVRRMVENIRDPSGSA
jgi:cation/acetate symporter